MAHLKHVDGALVFSEKAAATGQGVIGAILATCSAVILHASTQAPDEPGKALLGLMGVAGGVLALEQFAKMGRQFERAVFRSASQENSVGHGLTR